jgi:hypothetical protein
MPAGRVVLGDACPPARTSEHDAEPILSTPTSRDPSSPEHHENGDSYSSGEAAGRYDKSAGRCHRSASAWPRLLAQISQEKPLELALKAVTTEAGVRYISLRGVTAGHEMWTENSWFVDITTRRVTSRLASKLVRRAKFQELAHPRAAGQRAIAHHVAKELGLSSDR